MRVCARVSVCARECVRVCVCACVACRVVLREVAAVLGQLGDGGPRFLAGRAEHLPHMAWYARGLRVWLRLRLRLRVGLRG